MTAGERPGHTPHATNMVAAMTTASVTSRDATARAEMALLPPAVALALATLFWSGNFVAGRALRDVIDPVTLNFVRWLLALLLMVPFVWRGTAAHLPVLRREWRLILVLGATGIAAFHTLVYLALQTTTATNAILILSLSPIVTLFGSAIMGIERVTRGQIAGAAVSILGAGVLITRGDVGGILADGLHAGDLWMVVAVVLWAAYSLMLRRRPADLPQTVALTASIAVALAMLVPLLILFAPTPVAALVSVPVLLSIGYMAIFASAIAFLFWSHGVARLGPARAGQYVNLMPIFGAALSFAVLGEAPTLAQYIGAALVLSGLALVSARRS
jgi:drug/metabolite transporter (DMT)-like permease